MHYALRNTHLLTGATKSIPINALPEEAWRVIGGRAEADDGKSAIELRKTVGLLNRCINIRAGSVKVVPWVITTPDDQPLWSSDEQVPPPSLVWAKRLKQLLGLTETALCLKSESFWHIERSVGGKVLSLKWLSPLTMKPKWDKERGLVHFERTLGSNDIRLLKIEDVVYCWIPDPLHETAPDTPVAEAAAVAAGVLRSVDAFTGGFFDRGAIKATLLTIEGNPSTQEKSRLKAWWERFFTGVTNAWGTEVVSASVKPVPVGEGINELSNTELTMEKREEIAVSMGVPFSMLFSDASNFATAQQDKRNFYDETILPELDIIEPAINETLFNPLGLVFKFRHHEMDIYQEDETKRADSLAKYVAAGMPLPIAAEVLGVKLPQDMKYDDLTPVTPPPTLSAAGNPISSTEGEGGIGGGAEQAKQADLDRWRRKALKRLSCGKAPDCEFRSEHLTGREVTAIRSRLAGVTTKAGVEAVFRGGGADQDFFIWTGPNIPDAESSIKALLLQLDDEDDEAEQKVRMALERRATRDIAGALGQQQDILEQRISRYDEAVDWFQEDLEETLKQIREEHDLRDMLQRALLQGVDLGVSTAIRQFNKVGYGLDWTLAHEPARAWADRYTFDLVTAIDQTTERLTRQAVTTWIENGLPLDDLIEQLVPVYGRQRAERIAVTEVTRAFAMGSKTAYAMSGVVQQIQIQNSADERVCPVCAPLGGTRHSLETGHPELGFPPFHVNCRCWILPVI